MINVMEEDQEPDEGAYVLLVLAPILVPKDFFIISVWRYIFFTF